MPLEIFTSANIKTALDRFSFNKETGELSVTNSENHEFTLRISLPFKVTRLRDELFDPNSDVDRILIFRNNYFNQKSKINLKYQIENKIKGIGFILPLNEILENSDIIDEDKVAGPYALRAILLLLNNKTTLSALIPKYDPNTEFSLMDFYPEDLVICSISKQQIGNYSDDFELSLIYQMNLYGFYFLNSEESKHFIPSPNSYQQKALRSLLSANQIGTIKIELLNAKILNDPYFKTYITSLINVSQSYITKFFLIYQCYEILIDLVLQAEIREKVLTEGVLENKSGFQIRDIMMKIGTESFRMEKLFSHYCSFPFESDYHLASEIAIFFIEFREDYELQEKPKSGLIFYQLRNTITHNLKILFSGTTLITEKKEKALVGIINGIEFLTIEALIGCKV